MMRKVSLKTTLRVVNRMRKATGMKPLKALPKGHPGASFECPIAKALGCEIDGTHAIYADEKQAHIVSRMVRKGHDDEMVVMPMTLQNFVEQYDAHRFPGLELQ